MSFKVYLRLQYEIKHQEYLELTAHRLLHFDYLSWLTFVGSPQSQRNISQLLLPLSSLELLQMNLSFPPYIFQSLRKVNILTSKGFSIGKIDLKNSVGGVMKILLCWQRKNFEAHQRKKMVAREKSFIFSWRIFFEEEKKIRKALTWCYLVYSVHRWFQYRYPNIL